MNDVDREIARLDRLWVQVSALQWLLEFHREKDTPRLKRLQERNMERVWRRARAKWAAEEAAMMEGMV